jgi:hypothetical protein
VSVTAADQASAIADSLARVAQAERASYFHLRVRNNRLLPTQADVPYPTCCTHGAALCGDCADCAADLAAL